MRVAGDPRLEFVRDGKKCNMKFWDARVEKPLAFVSAIVDEGNIVVFGPQGIVHREREHWPEDSNGLEERRFVVQLDAHSGPARTRMWKNLAKAVRPKHKIKLETKYA